MKVILNIFCWVLVIFCIWFPFSYFKSGADKKEIKVSHILVNSFDEADKLKKEIENKEIKFEDAASKYSLCPSKEDKGDIGYNMRGMLIKDFENAAYKLEPYKISDPVKTQEGWHLIKVTDVKYFSDGEFNKRY